MRLRISDNNEVHVEGKDTLGIVIGIGIAIGIAIEEVATATTIPIPIPTPKLLCQVWVGQHHGLG